MVSVIATDANTFRDECQRKLVFDGTYWWCFYYDGSNIVYKYSSNGVNWSAKVSTGSGAIGDANFDVYIRGSTVALCWGDTVATNRPIRFKKGTISGTTISWNATVDTGGRGRYTVCVAVAIDTNNYYYVAFNGQDNYYPTVRRSTDGTTWSQVFQGSRSSAGQSAFAFILVPLSAGKLLFLFPYYDYNGRIDYAYFNGTSWSSQQNVAKTIKSGAKFDVIAACGRDTDDVHVIRLDDSNHVQYCKYTYPTTWSNDTSLESANTDTYPNIGMLSNDTLFAYYIYGGVIRRRIYTTSWGNEQTPFGTSFTSPAYPIAERNKSSTTQIGVAWMEGSTSPYTLKFSQDFSVVTGWRKLQYLSEPPTTGWNKLKYASEPPVTGAWNKLLYEGE
jgi:hypothetical protein